MNLHSTGKASRQSPAQGTEALVAIHYSEIASVSPREARKSSKVAKVCAYHAHERLFCTAVPCAGSLDTITITGAHTTPDTRGARKHILLSRKLRSKDSSASRYTPCRPAACPKQHFTAQKFSHSQRQRQYIPIGRIPRHRVQDATSILSHDIFMQLC